MSDDIRAYLEAQLVRDQDRCTCLIYFIIQAYGVLSLITNSIALALNFNDPCDQPLRTLFFFATVFMCI